MLAKRVSNMNKGFATIKANMSRLKSKEGAFSSLINKFDRSNTFTNTFDSQHIQHIRQVYYRIFYMSYFRSFF